MPDVGWGHLIQGQDSPQELGKLELLSNIAVSASFSMFPHLHYVVPTEQNSSPWHGPLDEATLPAS